MNDAHELKLYKTKLQHMTLLGKKKFLDEIDFQIFQFFHTLFEMYEISYKKYLLR